MTIAMIRHTVANFDAWKSGYDAHEPARRAAGCTSASVSRAAATEGATEVFVQLDFPDAAAAQGFLNNPALAEAMQAAGVIGIPDIHIAEPVLSTTY
ncbi:MAG: cyclase [Acidimicrobiales bacterium]